MAKDFSSKAGLPRGLRNNNPGNLKYFSSNQWKGQIGSDGVFARFINIAYGIRAWGIDIKGDIKEGTNTIEKLVYEFAPPSENNTQTYIDTVVNYSGIGRKQILVPTTETLIKLARGMFTVELGLPYAKQITDTDIREGIELMGGGSALTSVNLGTYIILIIILLTIIFTI